MADRQTER